MSDLDNWEKRFAKDEYVFGTEVNTFVKAHAPLYRAGQSVLAVADGEGRNGVWLAQQGLNVTALDFSPTALAKSRKLAAERGVALKTEQADLSQWVWPTDAYDIVVGIFIQFATPALRARIFAGMRQAVKPGGLAMLHGYRPEQIAYGTGGPRDVEHLYTRAMMEQGFGDWEIVELREHDTVIVEGAGHAGMSALIDLVARKPR